MCLVWAVSGRYSGGYRGLVRDELDRPFGMSWSLAQFVRGHRRLACTRPAIATVWPFPSVESSAPLAGLFTGPLAIGAGQQGSGTPGPWPPPDMLQPLAYGAWQLRQFGPVDLPYHVVAHRNTPGHDFEESTDGTSQLDTRLRTARKYHGGQ